MPHSLVRLSEWADLKSDYAALLCCANDLDAIENFARRMIDTDVAYSDFEAMHADAVQNGVVDDTSATRVRCRVLSTYDLALAGYRKLEKKYRAEVTDRRKSTQILSASAGALAASRDNLRTELSMQQRVLAERSAELEILNVRLAAQRDEMAGFLYSVSHDLKSPINTVRSLLTLFLEDNGEAGIDLTDIEDAVDTAARTSVMLDDLLNFSRTLDAHPGDETVDLDVLVSEVLRDLSSEGMNHDAEFTKDRLPIVIGSEFQLRLLFQNLISNGIKYCAYGCPARVKIENKGPRGLTHSAIAVTDNGIGIAPEHHHKVFKLFSRLHPYSEYPGTGLGLSLCQRIVLNHRGQIHLRSELGQGSTFTVVLPLG